MIMAITPTIMGGAIQDITETMEAIIPIILIRTQATVIMAEQAIITRQRTR